MTQDQELSEILDNYYAPIVLPDINRSGLKRAIEAYVTTRVKEAEAEEVEMAADFAEDVLQQFGYNGKSGGLSTLEWAEGIIKRHKKLQALTTTTNGKGE